MARDADMLFVFGATWGDWKDTAKLCQLEDLGFNVYTVGKFNGPSQHPKHLELDFKTSHGFTRVLGPVIAALKQNNMRVLVCLNHAFLQCNYYRDKYGTNWLPHKCLALIKIGVDEIFLPRDNGGEMEKNDH